jgi:hypothetical protein
VPLSMGLNAEQGEPALHGTFRPRYARPSSARSNGCVPAGASAAPC